MKGFIEITREGSTMLIALHNIAAVVKVGGNLASLTLLMVVGSFDVSTHTGIVDQSYDEVVALIGAAQ